MLKTQQYSKDSHLLLYYLALPIFTYSCFSCESRYFHLFDDSEGIKDGSSHVRKAYGLRSKCFWLPRFVAMKMNNKSLLLPSMPYFTRNLCHRTEKQASLQLERQMERAIFKSILHILQYQMSAGECPLTNFHFLNVELELFLSANKIRVTISFTTNRHRSGVLQDDQH